jgi:Fic-DOC domain mobile mystery protein B
MFGEVWRWAGAYRQHEIDLGIEPHRMAADMPVMLDDARYWVENNTYPPDEIAVHLLHRLTQIHPFANGNGRHAHMMADLLIERLGGKPFSWGGGSRADVGTLRTKYVNALQAADGHMILSRCWRLCGREAILPRINKEVGSPLGSVFARRIIIIT